MEKGVFYLLFIIVAALAAFACLGDAFAEGIDMGPCKLYPILNVEERYEDNIFQLANDAKGDFVTTATPELLLEFKCSGRNIFYADYKYEILRFDRYNRDDRENNKFKARFEIYGPDYFLKLREDFKEVTTTSTYAEYFDDYRLNDASATLGGDFNNVSFETTYQNLDYDYKTIDSANNYNEHLFDLTAYYKIFPKTKALLEYDFGKIKYDNDKTRDGDANEFLAGIKGELSQKMTGTIKLGYQSRDYEARKDWEEAVTYTNVLYEISQKTKLDFTFERKPVESTYTTENYYQTDQMFCRLAQKLTEKTTASFNVLYSYDKYPVTEGAATGRQDDIWGAKIALDIDTRRWLTSGVSYEFKKRNSNVSSYDYENNITSVYLKAMY